MRQKPSSRPAPAAPAKPAVLTVPWLRPAVIAAAVLMLFCWFTPDVSDSDTWWHLKTGQYMAQTHRLPVPDPFSYTAGYGKPAYPTEAVTRYFNLTHEWLSQ